MAIRIACNPDAVSAVGGPLILIAPDNFQWACARTKAMSDPDKSERTDRTWSPRSKKLGGMSVQCWANVGAIEQICRNRLDRVRCFFNALIRGFVQVWGYFPLGSDTAHSTYMASFSIHCGSSHNGWYGGCVQGSSRTSYDISEASDQVLTSKAGPRTNIVKYVEWR